MTYRIVKISDPRSRGTCYWFEVESKTPSGGWQHLATCDTRKEARDMIRQMEMLYPHRRTAEDAR
jgi:hypothetical protein